MKHKQGIRSIWYISGTLNVIMFLDSWVVPVDWLFKPYMWDSIRLKNIISAFRYWDIWAIYSTLLILGFFFIGLWCKYEVECAAEKSPAAVAASNGQARNAAPAIGDADKLKTYKSLLDSGVITQEEFEEKKRQILGL